jgi:DinB superfamily
MTGSVPPAVAGGSKSFQSTHLLPRVVPDKPRFENPPEMKATEINLEDVVAVLERTPASLTSLLSGLSDTWISATEGEGTWSPYDVVGHLIHGEHTDWIPRARHILTGDTKPFETFDRTAQFRDSQGKSLSELLDTFAALRRQNVATLLEMNLSVGDLSRKGLHPELGEVTLGQLLATWVAHDLDHVGQIARTMAKVYGEAVGPWSAYISILHDRKRK